MKEIKEKVLSDWSKTFLRITISFNYKIRWYTQRVKRIAYYARLKAARDRQRKLRIRIRYLKKKRLSFRTRCIKFRKNKWFNRRYNIRKTDNKKAKRALIKRTLQKTRYGKWWKQRLVYKRKYSSWLVRRRRCNKYRYKIRWNIRRRFKWRLRMNRYKRRWNYYKRRRTVYKYRKRRWTIRRTKWINRRKWLLARKKKQYVKPEEIKKTEEEEKKVVIEINKVDEDDKKVEVEEKKQEVLNVKAEKEGNAEIAKIDK